MSASKTSASRSRSSRAGAAGSEPAPRLTLDFSQIGIGDVARVGGKNASLGELFEALAPLGVGVLDGFATTADAYRRLLAEGDLAARLDRILDGLDTTDVAESTPPPASRTAGRTADPRPRASARRADPPARRTLSCRRS